LPPNMRDWLPEGHLASFILDTVDALDLDGFYRAYRADGHGRAAHGPAMMLTLLLYVYCKGLRSSRVIERSCWDDVGCRVITANQQPDHATIARFRQRHEDAIASCVQPGARAVREGGDGLGPRDRCRWHEAGGECEP